MAALFKSWCFIDPPPPRRRLRGARLHDRCHVRAVLMSLTTDAAHPLRSAFRHMANRDILKGVRIGLHALTFAVMGGWALMVLITGKTLYSNAGYVWFIHHWPYHDRAWGWLFLLSASVGSMTYWSNHRVWRFISAIGLGAGHVTIAHAVWTANSISTGVLTYSFVTFASVAVIALTILEDW